MSNNASRTAVLFRLYLNGAISKADYQELLELLNVEVIHNDLEAELKELWTQSADPSVMLPDSVWDKKLQPLLQKANTETASSAPVIKIMPFYRRRWAVAAAIMIVLAGSTFFFLNRTRPSAQSTAHLTVKDTARAVLPGTNKAVLVLADGTSIYLDNSSNGAIASQGSTKVIKLNSGQLVYNSAKASSSVVLYNTLSTPLGGQYQVTLADGTTVWLNAGSSLRYPTVFAGAERKVEITGEAYFEVAKDRHKPFKVAIKLSNGEGGEVEVLGTHFNVNAYDDEATVRTTLLEGSVKVNKVGDGVQLQPGQQLQTNPSSGQNTVVDHADLEEVVAWKDGRFQFESAGITSIMRQLARWYDLKVEYRGDTGRHFDGTISRSEDLSKVLNMLELTGEVKFKREGRTLTVIL